MARQARTAAVPELPLPSLELLESKLRPPRIARGSVPRKSLVDRLQATRDLPVVLVSAPPGYGKTTLLAQWASRSRRPFAWVSLDEHDNDPIVLLTYIAAALDRISPIDPGVFDTLCSVGASIAATVVPRLGSAMVAAESSFVLVLDDMQALTDAQSRDAIDALVDHVPSGSRLVLCGQTQPSRRVAALRARGLALEIGPEELRMDSDEASQLLRAAQTELPETEVAELVERTEGWPAGLYLAALSIREGGGARPTTFRGDDRFVTDYLRSELLSRLPRNELRFLTRTAALEQMSPALCDAVLESNSSAGTLESLERSNLFIVPLDNQREWYRYHRLFRELMRAELDRAEPDLVAVLLTRASDWCDQNGQAVAAVSYAQAAADPDRVARLVAVHGQAMYQAGRAVTVEHWLQWLEAEDALVRNPLVAALGAWFSAIRGRPAEAERWAEAAQTGALDKASDDDRVSVELWLALLRAAQCRQGAAAMRTDAETAAEGFGRPSRFWATAALLLGIAYRIGGDPDRADELWSDIVETATATGGWGAASLALSERAMLAIERDDWGEAESVSDEAASIARQSRMEEYPPNALVYAVGARVAAHRREPKQAGELLVRANRLRPQLTRVLAPLSIQARVELASAYVALGDAAGARTLLREAAALLRYGRDFGTLAAQADDLHAKLESVRVETPGASTLTTAELRLLPLLTTHLSFREIGERLFLSRHTVKSQAISVYRKLEVTSRNAAVERARELGML